MAKNIYKIGKELFITSEEEIKEGDWLFDLDIIRIVKADNLKVLTSKAIGCWYYKKIILTTDQDLINDGVQAIDDEFLEWFVKNPNCEEVEVKIDCDICALECTTNKCPNLFYKIIILKEEPKQETLEEAAERLYPISKGGSMWMPSKDDCNKANKQEGFIEGAKWQAESMYSEGDMRLAINKARDISDGKDCFDAEDISGCTEVCTYNWKFNMSEDLIIEQLKKKS